MVKKRSLLIVFVIFLLSSTIFSFPLTKQEKLEDWHYFKDIVIKNYPYFHVKQRVTGTSWLEILPEIERLVLESEDDQSFYRAISYAAATLQNGHTHVVHPLTYPSYASFYAKERVWKNAFTVDVSQAYEYWQMLLAEEEEYYSFLISYVGGSYYVTSTNDPKQLPLLSEVLAIDGKSVTEYVLEDLQTTQKLRDPLRDKLYVKRLSLPDKVVELTIKNDGVLENKLVEPYTTERPKEEENREKTTTTILQEGQIAYVKIPSFSSSLVAEDGKMLREFYQEVKDYPYLVIDIRQNGGGSDYYWEKNILEPLLSQKISVNSYVLHRDDPYVRSFFNARLGLGNLFLRRNKLKLEELPALPQEVLTNEFAGPVSFNYTIKPKKSVNFTGEIFLLVDEGVYSSAETFAMVAKASGFAYLVGTRTGGDGPGFDPIFFKLPHSKLVVRLSASMGLNPDGSCNEETHTLPDLYVENPLEYIVYGKQGSELISPFDKQLQAVLEIINSKSYKGKIASTFSASNDLFAHLFMYLPVSSDYTLEKFQGQTIKDVRIYGAYNSNKESLAKIINLLPGEKLDVAKLRMIEDKLNATGSFSQAAVACQEEKDGEVIVKIVVKESFLFL